MKRPSLLPQAAAALFLFFAGVISAQTWLATPRAAAQQTKSDAPTTPRAFLAADERMEPVVREILATIKKIDSRLEKIEKSFAGGKKPLADDAPRERAR